MLKTDVARIRGKISGIKNIERAKSSPTSTKRTLKDIAELYREKNVGKLEDKNQSLQEATKVRSSLSEIDPFLEVYYNNVSRSVKEKKAQEEEKARGPRTLRICLRYTSSALNLLETVSIDSENIVDLSGKEHGLLEFWDDHDEGEAKPKFDSKLVLNVVEGNCLHNGIPEGTHRSEKALVKIFLVPQGEAHTHQVETDYRYLTCTGDTRFNTKVLFKEFSKGDLDQRYLVIKVEGSSDHHHAMLGQAVISGEKALIKTDTEGGQRKPTEEEICPLREALENPGKSISTICKLTAEDFPCEQNNVFTTLEHDFKKRGGRSLSFPRSQSAAQLKLSQISPTRNKKVKRSSSLKAKFSRSFSRKLKLK